jgi:glucose/arabinose dehydrogenase
LRTLLLLLLGLAGAAPSISTAQPAPITPVPLVSGLSSPVEIVTAYDDPGRLYVAEQGGVVRVIRNGVLLSTPFLDISAKVKSGGEQGLLGIAFHPLIRTDMFVYYTRPLAGDPAGNEIVIERYRRSLADQTVADPNSAFTLLTIPHPGFGNHNGGKIAFGPDRFLYIGVGDGGGGGDPFATGQSLAQLRGKILRIGVDHCCGGAYAIPPDNPFVGVVGARAEIWSYGWRNPWRFSFDRASGNMLVGDVGQGAWEEIDFELRGAGGGNYGWNVLEGTHCFSPSTGCDTSGKVMPIIEYPHDSSGGVSVTGGYVYRGTTAPSLQGYYVYGDYGSGRIWAASAIAAGLWTTQQIGTLPNLSTFGEDDSGELYAANHQNGTIYRLTPAAETLPRMVNVSTRARASTGNDVVIGGFVIGGAASKRVAVVATGPSLAAHGIANPLANPRLTLVRSSDQLVVGTNDSWQAGVNASRLQEQGLAPSDPREAALMVELAPGAYTAIVDGAAGETGIAVVAVYEVDHPERRLVNLSTRANVGTGSEVVIGGFVIEGASARTVAIVGTGPSLAAHGVTNPLADPQLVLVRSSDQSVLASNDNWQSAANAAQLQASGFAPSHPSEAGILVTLPPGAYTAILSGVGSSTGTGVVAVYDAAP